jgi:hypothetical protein
MGLAGRWAPPVGAKAAISKRRPDLAWSLPRVRTEIERAVHPQEGRMGFSGARAVLMIVALVVLVVAVTKLDLPGWIIPVGLIVAGVLVKERRA